MNMVPGLFIFVLVVACGTAFDEGYWDDDNGDDREEQSEGRFSVNLTPVSALSFSNGDAALDLQGNSAFLRIEMDGVPQNISQTSVQITDTSCENFNPTPPTTGTLEIKNYNYVENGTRAALFRDLQDNDSVEGKFLVVHAIGIGQDGQPNSSSFPLACGPILRPEDQNGGTTVTTTGATLGGTTVGTVGGITSGTVGGTTVGNTTGFTNGTTAGATTGTTFGGALGE